MLLFVLLVNRLTQRWFRYPSLLWNNWGPLEVISFLRLFWLLFLHLFSLLFLRLLWLRFLKNRVRCFTFLLFQLFFSRGLSEKGIGALECWKKWSVKAEGEKVRQICGTPCLFLKCLSGTPFFFPSYPLNLLPSSFKTPAAKRWKYMNAWMYNIAWLHEWRSLVE